MIGPALISLEKDRKISQTVFKDLNLDLVFNEKLQAVLSHPCSQDELLARQRVFIELKRESVFEGVVACRSAIADLRREITLVERHRQPRRRILAVRNGNGIETRKGAQEILRTLPGFV